MRRRVWSFAALAVLLIGAACGTILWQRLLRAEDQVLPTDRARFAYGTLGGDLIAGIPYPIFAILPRVFPDLIARYAAAGYGAEKAAYGGYGAFGLVWEQGERMPVGISVRRVGYERVTVTCALCHTGSYRLDADDDPHIVLGAPGHTVHVQGLLRFLFAVAHDRRFSATRLLPEMTLHTPLDAVDWVIYAAWLIPKTRTALRLAEAQLGWMDERPDWGPGRDDAFNLPKFVLTQEPWDHSVGATDFPALFRMAERDGHLLHAGGEAHSVYAVSATSALGTGALPVGDFRARNEWIVSYLRDLEPPRYPGPVDAALARRGKTLFDAGCGSCHAPWGARVGTAIPLAEIGTDPEHVLTWRQPDAERMNALTSLLGARDVALQAAQGYVARPLTGAWLLAPYLHNGSVPTLRDLLSPPERRPPTFYRGYDVLDRDRVGFVSDGPAAAAQGFRFDTRLRGNASGGHAYGVYLPETDRVALLEFLKTL